MTAVVRWARAHGKHISIFDAKHHTEAGRHLEAEDLYDVLRYGDDSQLPTPGLFFHAQGMPVVVTRNQFTGLKVVHGVPFEAVDVFPDPAAGTIALASDATLHLGPSTGVLLQSSETVNIAIPGLPQGTILLRSRTVAIPDAMRGKNARLRGKPGFRRVTHRTGPQCTRAFAMADQKSQGKQFSEVLVSLEGVRGSSTATPPSFMSLYVQLSRQASESIDLYRLSPSIDRYRSITSQNRIDRRSNRSMLVLIIPICDDLAYQMENLPPAVPFKETKRKRRQINTSITPRTNTLSHSHNMAS